MNPTWKNLAPDLIRQRLIIEGTTEKIVEPEPMKAYLLELAKVAKMEVLSEPMAYTAHEMGYGGWIHWKSSGSHFYSYPTNPPLFTVDIYTCKPFSVPEVVDFTKKYFHALEIVWKEFEV
jgi:S-adenosylmethionine decarboxylase